LQDAERRRIARELHDSSGQILTAIGLDLASLAEQVQSNTIREIAPNLARQVEESQRLVQMLHRELRTTSYLLHPPLLDEAGLSSAIGWYVQGVSERSGITTDFDISKEFGRLPRELELVVFRVVQESLTNIHRHSGSKRAAIRIARAPEAITMEIEDFGKGISQEHLAAVPAGASGFGIRAMRERLRPFGGELQIRSAEDGTRVVVSIPLSRPGTSEQIEPAQAAM
jgi:two-component system NarL family sensor kinase